MFPAPSWLQHLSYGALLYTSSLGNSVIIMLGVTWSVLFCLFVVRLLCAHFGFCPGHDDVIMADVVIIALHHTLCW